MKSESTPKRLRRLLSCTVAAVSALFASSAFSQANCPGAGNCCISNGSPGCEIAACCQIICAADPFCCNTTWDGICANAAQNQPACQCGIPGACGPQAGHNCFTTGGPGCTNAQCCTTVCAADPFCCNNSWDSLCVNQAIASCNGCGHPDAGDCCSANGTPFCNNRTCCEAVCAFDPFCCTNQWDGICASGAATVAACNCGPPPPVCPPSDHNCFTTGGPGCTDLACCLAVCAADPFCCNNSWDGLCVNGASKLCDGCGDPDAGDCCVANGTPFCDDRTCCDAICAADPFCCNNFWDNICANAALVNPACPCAPPGCDRRIDFGVTLDDFGNPNACTPVGPIVITTEYQGTHGIVFGTAVDNFSPAPVGILDDGACTPSCVSAGLPPYATDWWCQFRFVDGTKAGVTFFSAELCFIDGPPGTLLMEGYNNARQLVATAANTLNGAETLTIFAPPGGLIAYVRVVASNPARPAGVSVDCLNFDGPFPRLSCPPSDHNCFTTGGPGCTDVECCDAVCAIDSFCCQVAWDGLCVDEASKLCDGCGDPDAGDCCTANGTPFCNDRTCCESVCSYDPFCCNNFWDGICADEARFDENCPCEFECPESDDCCFSSHPDPGCNNDECCALVCAADPFCCNVAWDSLCAAGASGLCAGCRADFNGDGFVNGADLGLLLGAWGTADPCYDLNGDGIVNGADLGLLLGAWGACTI